LINAPSFALLQCRSERTLLRVLVVFAHPLETSFGAALHAKVVETLCGRGHAVDDCTSTPKGSIR